jgi:hypothetical protein
MLQATQNNLKDTANLLRNKKSNFSMLPELFILDKKNNKENVDTLINNYEIFVSLYSQHLANLEYKKVCQECE